MKLILNLRIWKLKKIIDADWTDRFGRDLSKVALYDSRILNLCINGFYTKLKTSYTKYEVVIGCPRYSASCFT